MEERADEHGGEPASEKMTTEEMWERIQRIRSIEHLERLMVDAAKEQAARSKGQ